MNAIDELHTLVQDLRAYIVQEHPCIDFQVPQKAKQPPQKATYTPPPLPTPPPPVASVSKPLAPKQEMPKAAPLPPKPKKDPEIPKSSVEPVMQALARPFVAPQHVHLLDCLQAFEKLGIHTLALPDKPDTPPQLELVMVSFLPKGSEVQSFIQKVAASVSERIIPCSLYLQPGLTAAAECSTLAATKHAKAVIIAYQLEDAQKLTSWLAYFGDDLALNEPENSIFTCKRSLFGVKIYELVVNPSLVTDSGRKKELWSEIQKVVL
ncbi:MAG: hypothetical protein LLF94_09420 [Chlamydiales bacterium]|nr:hypothetical protein [Chlamydiales bacterium]